MGYKVTCNLKAGGQRFGTGDVYSGPDDLLPELLAKGLVVSTDGEEVKPEAATENLEKPKKKRSKKVEG